MQHNELIKSPNDPKQYRYLQLANGLRVLLVHQADSEKSAAALTINVGHFDDPQEREGLAHFLEHMLFLGSAHYPNAGEFQHFISEHAGSHNAWTGTEHSHFYFDIEHAAFAQGLARFGDMFCAPLFSASYVDKERQSIEAEFSMKLKDDSRRIYQAHKESINPAHPFAKFSVGNAQTLADLPNNSLQQAVSEFYQQQYSTSRMSLCLVGPQSLAELAALAKQHFAALPTHLPKKPAVQVPLYLPEQQGIQLNIRPHKSSSRLVVSFAMPDIQPWYRFKLVSFIAHLLGDEGQHSLLAYLKERELVNQLSAGGGIDGSNYKDFTVAFELTASGRAHYRDIVAALFSQIKLLKQSGFNQALFVERQRLLQWSFQFYEPSSALQTAGDLSLNMQHYPPEDIIFGDYRMELPPEALYQELLGYFCSDNMRIMLVADEVPVNCEARWYHTPYSIVRLDKQWLEQLSQQPLKRAMQLPAPNPYLQTELSLLPDSAHMPLPHAVCQRDDLHIWYKADTDFNTPKGHIFVQLTLPNSCQTLTQLAATRLWVELVLDRFNQQLYAATTAGLNYYLHVHRQGVSLQTSGLTANQIRLLSDILSQLPEPEFSEQRFNELKHQLCRHWENSSKNKPVAQLFSQLSAILQPQNPELDLLQRTLAALSFEQFQQFQQQLLQQIHLEALLVGNWPTAAAADLQQLLVTWLAAQHSSGPALPARQNGIKDLGPVWLQSVASGQTDHAIVIYIAAQQKTADQMACFMLANHVMSPRYFHQLRTEQQLGYLVGTGYVPINTLPGLAFYVQSPDSTADKLYAATVAFFQQFLEQIQQLTSDEFAALKQSMLSQLAERDTSLGARAKRLWLALGQQDYQFSLTADIQQALATLSRQAFIAFLQQLLAPDYDVLFLATDPAPSNSHVKTLLKTELLAGLNLL
ncbi:insulinase family protein [Alishewanella sp. SMS8]|uniref:insulinase family protein n=1 Tax=Alishewanella sp. SMS8 TaxID=2994676 RepID=UPI00274060CB|nr:insulinase family protein [Alishewanella sp. SMS8]MDP5458115.1 insulinase family protein [Alishewanella sp. SMS8]